MYIATKGKKTAHLKTDKQAELYRQSGWKVEPEDGGNLPSGMGMDTNPDEQMGYEPKRSGRTR